MKLYATVQSERASKGQGGNQFLKVDITGEHEETILSLEYLNNNGKMYLHSVIGDSMALTAVQDRIKESLKGNNQKGENKYSVCSWCGIKLPQSKLSEYCSPKCRYDATGKR